MTTWNFGYIFGILHKVFQMFQWNDQFQAPHRSLSTILVLIFVYFLRQGSFRTFSESFILLINLMIQLGLISNFDFQIVVVLASWNYVYIFCYLNTQFLWRAKTNKKSKPNVEASLNKRIWCATSKKKPIQTNKKSRSKVKTSITSQKSQNPWLKGAKPLKNQKLRLMQT